MNNEENTQVASVDAQPAATPFTEGTPVGSTITPTVSVAAAPEAPASEQLPPPPAEVQVPVEEPKSEQTPAPKIETAAESQPRAKQKHDNKKKERKPQMSDAERKAQWREKLLETKIIRSDLYLDALCDYALTHRGYNEKRNWANVLIRMHEHLVYRLLNRLETFTPADGEYIIKRLMQFLVDKPLGNGPLAWNKDTNNFEQRKALDEYFGLNCKLREIAPQDRILLVFRDAAWPSKVEEENNIGGSFAERYHYLVVTVVKFMTTGQEYIDGLFEGCYHNAPTDEFLAYQQRQQDKLAAKYGNRPNNGRRGPSWVTKDNKCKDCGSDVTKDENGRLICSNPLCDHNIAPVSEVAEGFGTRPEHRGNNGFSGAQGFPRDDKPRRNRDNRDHRHHDSDVDDGGMPMMGKKKHKGKKFRVNDQEADLPGHVSTGEAPVAFSTPGGEKFGSLSGVFDGLKLN